jgi:8-oxo-dGTP pyrophosphatase MutT (NUDIX family)
LGGHADGDTDLLNVALKEVREESGLKNIQPISEDIFSLETLTVDGHDKRGGYVPSHLHLNITYLIEACESDLLEIKLDENSDISWFKLEDAIKASTEPWFRERIYKKLNEKLDHLE